MKERIKTIDHLYAHPNTPKPPWFHPVKRHRWVRRARNMSLIVNYAWSQHLWPPVLVLDGRLVETGPLTPEQAAEAYHRAVEQALGDR